MTNNEINYLNYLELRRSNRTKEIETQRSNVAKEQENYRHNFAAEANDRDKVLSDWIVNSYNARENARNNLWRNYVEKVSTNENIRSNLAKEYETHRANLAKEAEAHRANVAKETEAYYSNRMNEQISAYNAETQRNKAYGDLSRQWNEYIVKAQEKDIKADAQYLKLQQANFDKQLREMEFMRDTAFQFIRTATGTAYNIAS